MTFSSRWLLAFRVGGTTAASLPHCPACHVVFNHSSWLSPFLVLHTTAKSLCLPADALWNGSKYLKPEKLHFFSPPLPPSLPTVTPLQIPLLLSWCETWSRQREVFESFGPRQVLLVTSSCGRPTRKGARTPVLYFLITQPARASKTKPKKKRAQPVLKTNGCDRVVVWCNGEKKMREEIQMLRNFFFSECFL